MLRSLGHPAGADGSGSVHVGRLPLDRLVTACQDETAKFRRREPFRDLFCFELFRRAVVERLDDAWAAVHAQYVGVVRAWVRRHPAATALREDHDYYVERAYQRFWAAIGPGRFGEFADTAALLKYLKMCVHSVLIDARRTDPPPGEPIEELPAEPGPAGPDVQDLAVERLAGLELWRTVERELADEAERRVVYLSYALGMKPGEIHARDPGRFPTVGEVYRVKRNALDRLRRSPAIQALRGNRENAVVARSFEVKWGSRAP